MNRKSNNHQQNKDNVHLNSDQIDENNARYIGLFLEMEAAVKNASGKKTQRSATGIKSMQKILSEGHKLIKGGIHHYESLNYLWCKKSGEDDFIASLLKTYAIQI